MKRRTIVLLVGLFLSVARVSAFADDPLVVYTTNPRSTWRTHVTTTVGSADPSFVLPWVTACGKENEPPCEPLGNFFIKTPWSGTPYYISFTEPDGSLSDIVLFDSLGPGGSFRVLFYSDPSLPNPSVYAGYSQFANYIEDAVNGYVTAPLPVCCEVSGLSVVLASDGEAPFDPFGYAYDTSDGIQFVGATFGGVVPEPTSLLLVATGVIGVVSRRRRTQRSR